MKQLQVNPNPLNIERVRLARGIGGYWCQDQAAVQGVGPADDGFFITGQPVTPGFKQIREPSQAYCVILTLSDGKVAYGDCVTVYNAGHAGRPPPLQEDRVLKAEDALGEIYGGQSFTGFHDASAMLGELNLDRDTMVPVAYGMSQAILMGTALANNTTMAQVLTNEYRLPMPNAIPGFAGSCGGQWEWNVDKAIARRLSMFPQSAMQTRSDCERLPGYVSWIRERLDRFGEQGYKPDLHFDFHGSLGRMFSNQDNNIYDYLGAIAERAKPYRVYFEDPFHPENADEALERMAKLRERIDLHGFGCGLIADEWANAPHQINRFAANEAAHAIQIKMPDNGSLLNAVDAIRVCQENNVLAYLGGSCNETDISARVTVHLGLAFGVWRMLTKPGLGFDEGLMIMTNELNRTLVQVADEYVASSQLTQS